MGAVGCLHRPAQPAKLLQFFLTGDTFSQMPLDLPTLCLAQGVVEIPGQERGRFVDLSFRLLRLHQASSSIRPHCFRILLSCCFA